MEIKKNFGLKKRIFCSLYLVEKFLTVKKTSARFKQKFCLAPGQKIEQQRGPSEFLLNEKCEPFSGSL
jgi:hypothetical protein